VRKQSLLAAFFLLALLGVFLAEVSFGAYSLSLRDIIACITGASVPPEVRAVLDMRLRRALAAVAVGAILGSSTMVLQSSLRNVLASPFTLGVQQAASIGAAVALMALYGGSVTRWSITVTNPFVVSGFAFLAALAQILLILALSAAGGLTAYAVVLVSVTMSFITQAILSLLQYLYFNEILVAALLFWTFGDVGRPSWQEIHILGITAALSLAVYWYFSMDLDLLMVGDDVARSSGVNPSATRVVLLLAAALATAVSVSFAGVIGFVGLAGGVMARQIAGWSNRRSLPLAATLGATLLVLSDLVGRTVLSPIVIPVGIMTTIIGAPLLVYLVVRGKHGQH